jgi:DNA polymerase (family X)
MHTTETDGRDTLETMARAAAAAGLEYIAITDHSKALAMANGLDEARALAHAARIRASTAAPTAHGAGRHRVRHPADGRMDLADDCLAQLDLVIASVHSALHQEEDEMTAACCAPSSTPGWTSSATRPIACCCGAPLAGAHREGHRRGGRHGVALEINSQPTAWTSRTATPVWRATAACRS